MSKVSFAATQIACLLNCAESIDWAIKLDRVAANRVGEPILLHALFSHTLLEAVCLGVRQRRTRMELATSTEETLCYKHFQPLATKLEMAIPINCLERSGNTFFYCLCVIDTDEAAREHSQESPLSDWLGCLKKACFTVGDRRDIVQQADDHFENSIASALDSDAIAGRERQRDPLIDFGPDLRGASRMHLSEYH